MTSQIININFQNLRILITNWDVTMKICNGTFVKFQWDEGQCLLQVHLFFDEETRSKLSELDNLDLKASIQLKIRNKVVSEDTTHWLLPMGPFQHSLVCRLQASEAQLSDQSSKLYLQVHASSNHQKHIDQVVSLFNN